MEGEARESPFQTFELHTYMKVELNQRVHMLRSHIVVLHSEFTPWLM
jgi:hypothetical protein